MTCIVGLVHEGVVYIGGDSAGVGGMSLTVRADEKVFQNGDFLMGFTTSFRMGQLLRYSLKPPRTHPDDDIHQYMVVDFVNAVRGCLKAGGYASKEHEVESGGTFLVGYAGHLFTVDSDYQVGIPRGWLCSRRLRAGHCSRFPVRYPGAGAAPACAHGPSGSRAVQRRGARPVPYSARVGAATGQATG